MTKKKKLVDPLSKQLENDHKALTLEMMESRIKHLEVCNAMLIQATKLLKDQVRQLLINDNRIKTLLE